MARGVKMGRKPKMTPHQMKKALRRREAGEPMRDIAKDFNVSHSTILRLERGLGCPLGGSSENTADLMAVI
jgi:hypothetical protein